ncbi:hypothetical protein AWC38_SpisGene1043 [Stylophora pistillata]|uniref:Uncharacterized protein n=1 Tax=Stylophora pistillata TaxID=50429 RepID=A0A2B4SXQ9_STYPI|nr:hypothetical protein AWC38_SpisGene1043 [Stylophora pistillata]
MFWQNKKKFEFSSLIYDSRNFLAASLNNYHPAAIFSAAIQTSADAVRKDVRNKWGHFDVTEWTQAFFNDCFSKLETLVRSLGLPGGKEKNTLDQLSDWRGKGCQLCMGHAVDKDLLSLLQTEVNGIIKDLGLQSGRLFQVQETAAALQVRLDDGEATRKKEMKLILERLTAIEKNLGEELLRRIQGVEEKVEQIEQRSTRTDQKVNQLGQGLSDRVNQLELKVETEKPASEKAENVHRVLEEGADQRKERNPDAKSFVPVGLVETDLKPRLELLNPKVEEANVAISHEPNVTVNLVHQLLKAQFQQTCRMEELIHKQQELKYISPHLT